MMETDCGSIYGEDVYSAELYSWETCWGIEICAPVSRNAGYVPPPAAVWPGVYCAPVNRVTSYVRPPAGNWGALGCTPLTVR
jgi:hypothetical protein